MERSVWEKDQGVSKGEKKRLQRSNGSPTHRPFLPEEMENRQRAQRRKTWEMRQVLKFKAKESPEKSRKE